MGIAVLGPLTIDGDGEPLGRRDRVVLAALVVHPGVAVSADRLADLLWDGQPPPTWPKVVQGCVVRLRKRLGSHAIETGPFGYRLALRDEQIDARRFEELVGRARQLLEADDSERSALALSEALALWRGPAYGELDGSDEGRIEAARLEELKQSAEELHVEASLRSGRHEAVLAKAAALVGEAPLRERRWALLALAQYQAGRQGEALHTLRKVRGVLQGELGLDPGPDLVALEQAILRQDASLVVGTALPEPNQVCPYPGLQPYTVDDADWFFGRDSDIASCLERLDERGILAVVGPSGCGKSSLVLAGVAATLRRNGDRVTVMTPGRHPVVALAALPHATGALVVDQCEEVFSLCEDHAERAQFLTALAGHAAAAPLVISFRADKLAEVSGHSAFAHVVEQGLYLLAAMGEPDLRTAIEGPATAAALVAEPGLVDLLVAEVGPRPGALPLMSHVLAETWKRREGRALTIEGYRASGGVQGAVAQTAEQVYTGVDPAQQAVLRDLLLRLVRPDADGQPVRSRLPRRLVVTDPAHDEMIDRLVAARLLTSDDGVVELAHEALARAWPRLRGWLDDDVQGQRILHHLAIAADAWDSLGRPDSELYRGVRLATVLDWQGRTSPTLTETERDFIEAGRRLSRTELRAAEERARHQSRVNRRLRGLLVTAVVLILVTVAAGLVALGQADRADRQAQLAEAGRAGARAVVEPDIDRSLLLAIASARLTRSPESLAALLAALGKYPQLIRSVRTEALDVTSLEVSPDGRSVALHDSGGDVVVYDVASGVRSAAFRPPPAPGGALLSGVTLGGGGYAPMAYSPDGRALGVGLAAPSRRPIRLLDPRTLRPLAHQPLLTFPVPSTLMKLGFDEGGTAMYALVHDFADGIRKPITGASLAVWDVTSTDDGVRLIPRMRRAVGVESEVGLSPDGGTVYATQPLTAYDVRSGRPLWRRPGLDVHKVDASMDGRLLALVSRDSDQNDVVLVDARTGETRHRLAGHSATVTVARFSPAGGTLVSTAVDKTGIVWDSATGRMLTRLPLARSRVYGVGFSPNGHTLYTASDDGALRMWGLTGVNRSLEQLAPPGAFVFGCTYPSPGGRRIATMGPEGIRFTEVSSGRATAWAKSFVLEDVVTCGSWHPDGRHFVTTALGTVRVYDAGTGRVVREAKVQKGELADLDYSGGAGTRIVVGDATGSARLLDAATLEQVGRTVDVGAAVRWVSASPDGRTALLVTGGKVLSSEYEAPSTGWAYIDLVDGRVLRKGPVSVQDALQPWFSPDARHVAIGSARGEVEVLDTSTGRFLRQPVPAHQKGVQYVAWNEDGSRFVSSGFDGSVSLFDGTTGMLLGTVVADTLIVSADFEPDSQTVLIASNFQAIYRWDTRIDHLVDLACRSTSRNLTRAEWAETFGSRPYAATCPRR